jgi:hypothetical protein
MSIETKQVSTRSTYTTDCFRKITDKETGVTETKRWQQDHQVMADLQMVDKGKGGIFHNGARIA